MKGVLLLVSLITAGFGGRITTQAEPYFACSSKYLFAFGEKGDLKWKTPVGSRGCIEQITEDMVVLRSPLKERKGIEYASYEPATGNLIWKTAVPYHDSIYVGYNETLYVVESDLGNYLLNLKSGEFKFEEAPKGWKSHGSFVITGGKGADTSKITPSPERPEKVVVARSSKFIFGFDPECNMKWKLKLPKNFRGWSKCNNIYALRAGSDLMVIDALIGKIKWRKHLPVNIRRSSIKYPEWTVYLENDEKLILNIETGEPLEKETKSPTK